MSLDLVDGAVADPDPCVARRLRGLLYLGPDVEQTGWKWVSPGAAVALVIWLAASAAFSLYASRFGSYQKTWGTLSAVVVTMIWLWLTSVALLLGAEVNAESERLADERSGMKGATGMPTVHIERLDEIGSGS